MVVVSLFFELQGGEEEIILLLGFEEFEGFEEENEEAKGVVVLGFQVAAIFDIVPGWW